MDTETRERWTHRETEPCSEVDTPKCEGTHIQTHTGWFQYDRQDSALKASPEP